MATPEKVPLIAAGERALAGEAREQAAFASPDIAYDITYVPGYSDKRRAFDGAVRNKTPKPRLTHRYQWVTVKNAAGAPDGRKTSSFQARGYRPVKQSDLAGLNIEMPPAAQVDATGHIVLGDTMLFVTSAEVAARNENVLRRATDERSSADATAADLHQEGSRLARTMGRRDVLTEATLSQKVDNSPT